MRIDLFAGLPISSRMLLAIAALAFALSGCKARDPYVAGTHHADKKFGNWLIERQTDRITNVAQSSALLLTRSASNASEAFTMPARLQVSCFKSDPLVEFRFSFKVGSTPNSVLGYRVDDKPGREPNARFLHNVGSVVIEELQDVRQFLADLMDGKQLYIRIRSLNAGRTAAEFQLDGARQAIETTMAQCPGYHDTARRRIAQMKEEK